MALHTLNTATDAASCFAALRTEDTLLIMDSAVYLLAQNTASWDWSSLPCPVYVLLEDLSAAGLVLPEAVKAIDYSAWVALSTEHKQHVAWY
mgnify:CR=1 FL=1